MRGATAPLCVRGYWTRGRQIMERAPSAEETHGLCVHVCVIIDVVYCMCVRHVPSRPAIEVDDFCCSGSDSIEPLHTPLHLT